MLGLFPACSTVAGGGAPGTIATYGKFDNDFPGGAPGVFLQSLAPGVVLENPALLQSMQVAYDTFDIVNPRRYGVYSGGVSAVDCSGAVLVRDFGVDLAGASGATNVIAASGELTPPGRIWFAIKSVGGTTMQLGFDVGSGGTGPGNWDAVGVLSDPTVPNTPAVAFPAVWPAFVGVVVADLWFETALTFASPGGSGSPPQACGGNCWP